MRKFLALIMAVAMIATFASVVFAAETKTVAHYTFDDNKADEGLTEYGTVTYADGMATFGADGYLRAPLDLTGATAVKVTVKLTPPTDVAGARWIFDITSDEKHNDIDKYMAAYFNSKNDYIDGEAYGGGARPDHTWVAVATPTEPIEFVYAYDETTRTVTTTVNGEGGDNASKVLPDDGRFTIANMAGENPFIQLGKANWGDGEFANTLVIDEVTVEVTTGSAPQTGFATIALAIAAVASGAYVVSKKH